MEFLNMTYDEYGKAVKAVLVKKYGYSPDYEIRNYEDYYMNSWPPVYTAEAINNRSAGGEEG